MGIAEAVKLRLKMFKITASTEDEDILEYLINKSLNSINNITNQDYTADTFPTPIFKIWVDKVAGDYINLKKTTGGYEFSGNTTLFAGAVYEHI